MEVQAYCHLENDGVGARWSRCSNKADGYTPLQGNYGCVVLFFLGIEDKQYKKIINQLEK